MAAAVLGGGWPSILQSLLALRIFLLIEHRRLRRLVYTKSRRDDRTWYRVLIEFRTIIGKRSNSFEAAVKTLIWTRASDAEINPENDLWLLAISIGLQSKAFGAAGADNALPMDDFGNSRSCLWAFGKNDLKPTVPAETKMIWKIAVLASWSSLGIGGR